MRRHEYLEACSKFRESDALDPSPGTRLNWALCDEQVGRIAEALVNARWALSRLGPDDDRRPIAIDVAADLEQRVPRLTLRLQAPAAADAKVYLDGEPVSMDGGSATREVDPGEHIVFVEQPSHEAGRIVVTLREGERSVRDVAAGPEYGAEPNHAPQSAIRSISKAREAAGYVFAGTAGAALLTTITMGVFALGERDVVNQQCPAGVCSPRGFDAADRGRAFVHVGEVSLAVSLAAAAGSSFFLLPALTGAPAKTFPSGAGLQLVGRF